MFFNCTSVEQAERFYERIKDRCFPPAAVPGVEQGIKAAICAGTFSWDDLTFSVDDLSETVRLATVVYVSQGKYSAMATSSGYTADFWAQQILQNVADGRTTWSELGFTEDDVQNRLRQQQDAGGWKAVRVRRYR